MRFLVRFLQVHEAFRTAELEALAELHGVEMRIVEYCATSPFCLVDLPSPAAAKAVVSRALLAKAVYELWARGASYDELHEALRAEELAARCRAYERTSFRFAVDSFRGSRSADDQVMLVNSFGYLGFKGPIRMRDAAEEFAVFEEFEELAAAPKAVAFGRLVGHGGRDAAHKYSLKTRKYLSTTSMDSELALIGANLALAAPGKIVYDPFVGTGGLPLACAHFGALGCGSDIDGRAVRGKNGLNVYTNYGQYGLDVRHLDSFISDLTHSPLRRISGGWLDIVVCDPPYGVREGLKVLGSKDGIAKKVALIDGVPSYLLDDWRPPKKPYSFDRLLSDIMQFAAEMLRDNGRLSFWMPTANDEDQELGIPSHPCLTLVSSCVQPFNKWSRRLLTYRRLPGIAAPADQSGEAARGTADELNNFRKRYFESFRREEEAA